MVEIQKKSIVKQVFSWLKPLGSALGVLLLIKAFLLDFYIVPSSSMESSILKGDFIIGSKLHYGPRLPMTPLSIPFAHQQLSTRSKSYSTAFSFGYYRIPGFGTIDRFDPMIFNFPEETEHPIDQRTFYVKRVIGLPGDTIATINKVVYINNQILPAPIEVQYNYILYTKGSFNEHTFEQLGIRQFEKNLEHNFYQITTTTENFMYLKTRDYVKSIKRINTPRFKKNEQTFPLEGDHKWNPDNFGPIVIPAHGLTVTLTKENYYLYEKVIGEYENQKIAIFDGEIYINGLQTDSYTFQLDYYYTMGDNRDNSNDSRFWGFVPENHVVGKAISTVYSIDDSKTDLFKKFRWNRFFKSIN